MANSKQEVFIMQKTSNYQLNQWAATDPIDRKDFNSDNAAIDAALTAGAAALETLRQELPLVRLGHCTCADGNVNADFDLSGVDMSQFAQLHLWVGGVTAQAGNLSLRFNGDASARYGGGSTATEKQITLLTLNTATRNSSLIACMLSGQNAVHLRITLPSYISMSNVGNVNNSSGYYGGCAVSGLTSVQVFSSQSLNAGIEVTLYGVRK